MNKYSDTYITIDKEALLYNAEYFINRSKKKLIAVVKSNAYGHDMLTVASILNGVADTFAVASLDEAVELRTVITDKPILVLNPINTSYLDVVFANDLMISVSSLDYLKEMVEVVHDKEIKVQIKIDSGMNRMGLKDETEYKDMIDYIKLNTKFKLLGVYTHFHTASDLQYSQKQITRFKEIYNSYPFDYEYVHICSSNAVINNLDIPLTTHVRIGIGLYGLADTDELKQVLSLYSKILLVKEITPGEIVGYNANYHCRENEYVGIVPVGYSDGVIRRNVGRNVYVDGHYCEILGTICMNSFIIKLPHKDVKKEVEIIGPHISTRYVAEYTKTITYEVVTCLFKDINKIVL